MPRVAIVGATGFLGRRLVRVLLSRCALTPGDIRAYGRKRGSIVADVPVHTFDIGEPAELDALISDMRDSFQPTHVFYLAAMTSFNTSDEAKAATRHVNVVAALALADACASAATPAGTAPFFVYTSTDMVFAGDAPPYSVASDARPITFYGQTKREAELALLAHACAAAGRVLVARLPLMYGVGQTFLETMRASFVAGEAMTLFTDELRTCALGSDVCLALCWLAGVPVVAAAATPPGAFCAGLWHLGGPERVSRHAMGLALLDALRMVDGSLARPGLASELVSAPRPRDISLDSSATYAVLPAALHPRGLADGLAAALEEGACPLVEVHVLQ